jgi:hypothetical protein
LLIVNNTSSTLSAKNNSFISLSLISFFSSFLSKIYFFSLILPLFLIRLFFLSSSPTLDSLVLVMSWCFAMPRAAFHSDGPISPPRIAFSRVATFSRSPAFVPPRRISINARRCLFLLQLLSLLWPGIDTPRAVAPSRRCSWPLRRITATSRRM